jgi:hypothetical protein
MAGDVGFSDESFNRDLLKYIRLREKATVLLLKRQKSRIKPSENKHDTNDDTILLDSYEEEKPCDKLQTRMMLDYRESAENEIDVWHRISEHLYEMKYNDEVQDHLVNFTNFLKLHIDNRVPLANMCIRGLVSCLRPSYIEDLFDLGLIDEDTLADDIFTQNRLFSSLKCYLYEANSVEPFYVIMSLAVLLYKVKCFDFKSKIELLLYRNLARFVFSNHFNSNFKTVGIKSFINACLLNGLLDKTSVNFFLNRTSYR